jgi:hypothetical protein
MAYYRLYHLRGVKNEVQSFEEFDAKDDAGAIAQGDALHDGFAMELWSGHRKVHRWETVGNETGTKMTDFIRH